MSVLALFLIGHAPSRPLNLATIEGVISQVGTSGGFLLLFASAAISLTLQPLQFRLVQLYEGYWSARWLGGLFRFGVWRQTRRFDRFASQTASVAVEGDGRRRLAQERRDDARSALLSRLPSRDHLLPTELGNVLRAMEQRAGARYGIESILIWRRLYPVLPKDHAESLENEVIQLDVSVRLSATWVCTGLVALGLLVRQPHRAWQHWPWLVVVGLLFVASWMAYRAAIESALAHSSDVEVTLDLFRDFVLDASRMAPARTLGGERKQFDRLVRLYTSRTPDHGVDYALAPRRLTMPGAESPTPRV